MDISLNLLLSWLGGFIVGFALSRAFVWVSGWLAWVRPPGWSVSIPVHRRRLENLYRADYRFFPVWLQDAINRNSGVDGDGRRWI